MRVTQIFLLFLRNSFFSAYRHSDLEGSYSNGTKTRHGESRCFLRAVAGREICHWAARFETFTEMNCWAYDACAWEVWTEGDFTFALFQGWGVGSEVLLEQVQLNFSFRKKFIILLSCDLRVENNTFSRMTPVAASCHCPRGWQTTNRAPASVLKFRFRPLATFKNV